MGFVVPLQDIFVLPWLLQNISFLTVHNFYSFVPIAQQPGQAAVPGRLSLSRCLWSRVFKPEPATLGDS
jgi:hypothetical protein